jgi:hypothetical protein
VTDEQQKYNLRAEYQAYLARRVNKPYIVNQYTHDGKQVGFWAAAERALAEGGRLVPFKSSYPVDKTGPFWEPFKGYAPTNDDLWKAGRQGVYGIGSGGKTYDEMEKSLILAQHPGAISVTDQGEAFYGGGTAGEERRLRAEAQIKYGARYIENLDIDSDLQLKFDTSGTLAERMSIAERAYRNKAIGMAEAQDEHQLHGFYEGVYNYVGKYWHDFRQKGIDLMRAGLANGYGLFSGDERYQKIWEEEDKKIKGDFLTKAVYNRATQAIGASIHADLGESILWKAMPWNWFKQENLHLREDVQGVLTYMENHPGMSAELVAMNTVDKYWRITSEDWLNPADWVGDKAFDVIFPPLMAVTVGRMAGKLFPKIARKSTKITDALAVALSKVDDNARLGGITDDTYELMRRNGVVDAMISDMTTTINNLTDWADERAIWTHTNETKALLTAEEVHWGTRWMTLALDGNPDPTEFYELMKRVGDLASEDKTVVDAALTYLGKYPDFDYWFTQSGQTAAYMFSEITELEPKFLDNLLKQVAEGTNEAEKVDALLRFSDEMAIEHSKKLFPDIAQQIKDGKDIPTWLKAANKTHLQAQKRIYEPITQWFSNWYLGRTPGYAVRNGVQNFAQTIFDLGIGSSNGWRHVDEAMDWAGVARARRAGQIAGEQAGDIFMIGMGRELAGIEAAALGAKSAAKKGLRRFLDMRWWSGEAEKLAGRTIFGHQYPREMRKMLDGNLSKQFRSLGVDRKTAQRWNDILIANRGDYKAAFNQIRQETTTGVYKNLGRSGFSRKTIQQLDDYNMMDKVLEVIASEKNFDDAARTLDDWNDEIIENAKKILQKEGGTGPPAGAPRSVGYAANAVAFHGANSVANDVMNSYITANKATNAAVSDALFTLREVVVDSLTKHTGASMEEAKDLFHKMLRTIKLEPTGEFSKVGRITGWDYYVQRRFSGSSPIIEKIEDGINLKFETRLAEMPTENGQKLWDWWAEAGMIDEFGEIGTRNWQDVRDNVWQSFQDETKAFWDEWSDLNYDFARKVSDNVLEQAVKVGAANVPPTDRIFSKATQAMEEAKKYQKWIPEVHINFNVRKARRYDDVMKANQLFAINYARRYGIDVTGIKEGRQYLNHKKLTSIINKQLGTKFDDLWHMDGIGEKEIMEALKMHSLGRYRNIVAHPDEAVGLIMKLVDPGDFGNLRMIDRMTPGEVVKFTDMLEILKKEDPYTVKKLALAIQQRRNLPNVQQATTHEMYNAISQQIKRADDELIKVGDDILELLGAKTDDEIDDLVAAVVDDLEAPMDWVPEWSGETAPTQSRVIWESRKGRADLLEEVKNAMRTQWDDVTKISKSEQARLLQQANQAEPMAKGMVNQARRSVMKSVTEQRDFILHNYGDRRNFDTLLAYIYPYHFWHTRNAANWAKRVARRPGIARGYVKYKENMRMLNEDMPEWYRYNAKYTGGLLGYDETNPLFINLEALVSPMYAFTKVPYNDPDRRKTDFAAAMDTLGQRGPNIHTMYALAYGFAQYVQGDREAAQKWMGRLIPQTKQFAAITALAGLNKGRGVELDPVIGLQAAIESGDIKDYFSGLDPWEQKRIAMAYTQLEKTGQFTEEEIVDALMADDPDHPITALAHRLAQSKRSLGEIISFFGGPGMQFRGAEEMQIMKIDQEFYSLMEDKAFMEPEEYAQMFQLMKEKYPTYFNVTRLARKDRDEREEAFVYSVMGRFPPGQRGEIYEAIGLTYEAVTEFYDSKGESLKTMPEADRMKFMAGIYEAASILAYPDAATRNEWKEASTRWKEMTDGLKEHYGDDVFKARDIFWNKMKEDPDLAYQWLEANPQVRALMSDEAMLKLHDPLLKKYYASFGNTKSMLNAEMYDRLEDEFPGIQMEQDAYWQAVSAGERIKPSDRLKAYWSKKDALEQEYTSLLLSFGRWLPEGGEVTLPKRTVEDLAKLSEGAQQLADLELDKAGVPVYYQWNLQQWEQLMNPMLARLVQDWAFRGAPLGEDAQKNLEYALEPFGIDLEEAMMLIRDASEAAGAQYYGPDNPPWWQE